MAALKGKDGPHHAAALPAMTCLPAGERANRTAGMADMLCD